MIRTRDYNYDIAGLVEGAEELFVKLKETERVLQLAVELLQVDVSNIEGTMTDDISDLFEERFESAFDEACQESDLITADSLDDQLMYSSMNDEIGAHEERIDKLESREIPSDQEIVQLALDVLLDEGASYDNIKDMIEEAFNKRRVVTRVKRALTLTYHWLETTKLSRWLDKLGGRKPVDYNNTGAN